MSDAVKPIVDALTVLYSNPDRDAKLKADQWLHDFQKSVRPSVSPSRRALGCTAPAGADLSCS